MSNIFSGFNTPKSFTSSKNEKVDVSGTETWCIIVSSKRINVYEPDDNVYTAAPLL